MAGRGGRVNVGPGLAIAGLEIGRIVSSSYLVTTTISSKGQIVIPRQVRERLEIRAGDDFLLLELANGDILPRRSSPPEIVCVASAPDAGAGLGAESRACSGGRLVE